MSLDQARAESLAYKAFKAAPQSWEPMAAKFRQDSHSLTAEEQKQVRNGVALWILITRDLDEARDCETLLSDPRFSYLVGATT